MRFFIFTLVLAAGCSSDTDAADGVDTDIGETADDGPFYPETGRWDITDQFVAEDGCSGMGGYAEMGMGGAFDLESSGDEAFVRVVDGESVSCDLDDRGFLCERSQSTSEIPLYFGLDATIHIDGASDGAFTDARALVEDSDVEITCTGPDCAMVEEYVMYGATFPCTMSVHTEAELAE